MGIRERRNVANSGHRLDEDFLPFAVKFGRKKSDARRISTGLGKGAHEPLADHIVGQTQNWNAGCGPLCGETCCIAARPDNIAPSVPKFGRMLLELLGGQAVTVPIDREVLPLDKAEPPQLIEQCNLMRRVAWSGVDAT